MATESKSENWPPKAASQTLRDANRSVDVLVSGVAGVICLLLGSDIISIMLCGVAVVRGHMERLAIRKSSGTRWGSGIALAGLILGYAGIIGWSSAILSSSQQEIRHMIRKSRSADNLRQMAMFLIIYERDPGECNRYPSMQPQDLHRYPSMQPQGSHTNGGVRDLYPLYKIATDKKAFLALFQPSWMQLKQFSETPSPDEFDCHHIAYEYNSLVEPHGMRNPPLMAERGVADGYITQSDNPVFQDGAHVLLADGRLVWLNADRGGRLLLDNTGITLEGLANLNPATSKMAVPEPCVRESGMGTTITVGSLAVLAVTIFLLKWRHRRTQDMQWRHGGE